MSLHTIFKYGGNKDSVLYCIVLYCFSKVYYHLISTQGKYYLYN